MTTTAIALGIEALAALINATPCGDGYKPAHCPHPDHPDLHPSLSLFIGDDGNPKLKCQSRGCDPKEIGQAIGIKRVGGQWYHANEKVTKTDGPARSKRRSTRTPKQTMSGYATLDAAMHYYERKFRQAGAVAVPAGQRWRYTDDFSICRFDPPHPDGSTHKEVRPIHRGDDGRWHPGDPPEPLPLYQLADLKLADESVPVLVTEGEKTTDIGRQLWQVSTSSAHGSNSPHKTDWSPLAGRTVVIWADVGGPGEKYRDAVAHELLKLDPPAIVKIIDPPAGLKDGEDIEQWRDAGGDADALSALVHGARDWSPPKPQATTPITGNGQTGSAFDLTDDGNALRFASRYTDIVRYVHDRRCWAMYDGTRWIMDAPGEIIELTRDMVRHIADETDGASEARRQEVLKWAARSHQEPSIKRVVSLAMSDHRLQITTDQFDSDAFLLNARNGTIELRTGELREHRREDFITKMSPVPFEPGARDDAWDKFLCDATGGHGSGGDPQLINFLQRFGGYSISGDTGEELFAFVHGPAASGKSTFMEAIKAAIGDYGVTANFETFLEGGSADGSAHRSDIARLAGSRLVASIEVAEGKRLAVAVVQWLTGRDTVVARFMYQGEFEFRPTFTLWLVANRKPRISADDDAIWRRIKVLPFTHQVPPSERDPQLKARLADPAIGGPAVLAWLVEGCVKWQRDGLQVPDIVATATTKYQADEDTLGDFIGDRLKFGDRNDRTTAAVLWSAYKSHCESNGITPVGRRRFTSRLQVEGAATEPNIRPRTWRGVSIREPDL